ncbi:MULTISPECIES: hypothetical protein [Roseomonadaceae]|uniref:Oligopeptide/dipeptide ABC transporter C-terminal domain-containing protein n=1 Tax=Falsiroseomonas oleicola TaxID=2801474 RepID=A0ABS6H6L6_9PROT|nr:hypothetical protein [Roseomonas oleicola]MBU8544340.1 hypothetical protein [Roseomonas oleicola]
MEIGASQDVLQNPVTGYAQALVAAMPRRLAPPSATNAMAAGDSAKARSPEPSPSS